MAELNKKSGCAIVIVILFIIGEINKQCEKSERDEITNYLNTEIKQLEVSYLGTYTGTIHSSTNIPSADIYPEDYLVTLKIISFVPVVVFGSDESYHKNKSESFCMYKHHIEGIYSAKFYPNSGQPEYFNGRLYYFPEDKKFCLGSVEGDNSSSLFGGDICEIKITVNDIEIYAGNTTGKLLRVK